MATSDFEISEVLACARYGDEGDYEDLVKFVELHGAQALADARDEHGNTALHLSGANGHQRESTGPADGVLVGSARRPKTQKSWEPEAASPSFSSSSDPAVFRPSGHS